MKRLFVKIFQCTRFTDPLGNLASAEYRYPLLDTEKISLNNYAMVWAVLSRLQIYYLDSKENNHANQCKKLKEKLELATKNEHLIFIMDKTAQIVNELGISNQPLKDYTPSNLT